MKTTCFYWNHHTNGPLLGVGKKAELKIQKLSDLNDSKVSDFISQHTGTYIFGIFSFELKDHFEVLSSNHSDQLDFPLLHLWIPESLYQIQPNLQFIWGENNAINDEFAHQIICDIEKKDVGLNAQFKNRTAKDKYFKHFDQLKAALQDGEIYEVNYCQELFAQPYELREPLPLFGRLIERTKAPHAAFIQTNEHCVLCASPERFLLKRGSTLITEPIKGTAPRNPEPFLDKALALELQNNQKERAENIMIVDLVRNDLSRIAQKNSVRVDELCEIYSFETVHQMISKVSCKVDHALPIWDILKATFPMGSMTGAPKIAALKQIEAHEDFKRGLYSGSIGLIEPNGDFDFNVVIRSLLYNYKNQYLSCAVGSAITIKATPEDEYNECMLKAQKLIYGLD